MRRASTACLLAATITAQACQAVTTSPSPAASDSVAPATSRPSALPSLLVDVTETSYQPEAGSDGGAVVIGDWQEAKQFNPYYLGEGAESAVASAVWATLVKLTSDLRYQPDLATEVPTVYNGGVQAPGDGDDAMTVTWRLRPNLAWSDGEPLTCDDFKYAWEWVLDKENFGVVTSGFEDIDDVECASDTEMVWHFKKVYAGYLTLMTAPLPRHRLDSIAMKDQAQGVGFRSDEVPALPVSGPFRFESVVPGVEIRLVRNPRYASPARGTPAHLDAVTFRWFADRAAAIAAFRAGKVDVVSGLAEDDLGGLADLGDSVLAAPSLTYEALRPNWAEDACSTTAATRGRGPGCPTADPEFRKAIALAIDRSVVATRALGTTGAPAGTNVSPQAWFYARQVAPSFDSAEARRALEAAGWTDGDGDGTREKNGLEARVEICSIGRQVRLDTVALVIGWLKEVGIQGVLREADPDEMFAPYDESTESTPCALRRGNFDLAIHSMTASVDPGDYYFEYHSSQLEPDGENDAGVNDIGIDVALETARNSVHPAVIRDGMAEFEKVYVDRTAEIPLYFSQAVDLRAPKVGNVVGSSPLGGATWNAADWFVKS